MYAIESTYKGFNVVGNIEIPKISINFPILEKVTKSSLNTSVAFLYGKGINQVGNSVIIGHNFGNGMFFSNLYKLENGDYIKITDMENTTVNYKIYKTETTNPEDTSFYNRDTNGKKEITLSTSTNDSSARFLVFASETTDKVDDSVNNNNEGNSTDKKGNFSNNTNNSSNNNANNTQQGNNIISTNNIINKSNSNINNNNKSIAKTTLPKTGRSLMFIIFFIIAIICTIISCIKFKKYKKF